MSEVHLQPRLGEGAYMAVVLVVVIKFLCLVSGRWSLSLSFSREGGETPTGVPHL